MLGVLDNLFVGYNDRERINLVGLMIFENFDSKKLMELIFQKGILAIPKLRSRVVSFMGNFFWKEVSIEESSSRLKIIDNSEIKNDDDVLEYISKDINSHFDILKELPYQIKIIPYKDSTKGAILFKFNHVLSDGLGMISLICCLADNYDKNLFPSIMKNYHYRWYLQIIDWLTFIYYGPIVVYRMFERNNSLSPFRMNKNQTGQVDIRVSKDYKFDDFTRSRKLLNLSFNDIIMCCISAAFKKLCQKHPSSDEFKNLKNFKCLSPVGRKSIPDNLKNLELNNGASGVFISIPLINNIEFECEIVSNVLKNSLKKTGFFNAITILSYISVKLLPRQIINYLAEIFLDNVDMMVSNIPGPTSDLFYAGCKLTKIIAIPSVQITRAFIPICSYNKEFRFVLSVGKNSGIDQEDFISLIDQEIQRFI